MPVALCAARAAPMVSAENAPKAAGWLFMRRREARDVPPLLGRVCDVIWA